MSILISNKFQIGYISIWTVLVLSTQLFFVSSATLLHAVGQRRLVFDPATEAGRQIQAIQARPDTRGKISKLYVFLREHPKDEMAGWAREELQALLLAEGELDMTIAAGEKLLEFDPLDILAAERNLEATRLKKADTTARQKQIDEIARKIVLQPIAKATPEVVKYRTETASRIVDRLDRAEEYRLYQVLVDAPTAASRLSASRELLDRFPAHKERRYVLSTRMAAALELRDYAAAVEAAEQVLQMDPKDDLALLSTAQIYLQQKRNLPKVIEAAKQILANREGKAGEQDLYFVGQAHLVLGSYFIGKGDFPSADFQLRSALKFVKGPAEAPVLFYLGWANYNMEKYEPAFEYFTQCLQFGGQYAEQAQQNIKALKSEGRIP